MTSKFAECKLDGLSRVVCNVGAYRKLKTKPKTFAELKESLQVIWSNLPQGPIDKTVKDFQIKRLTACVGAWNCRWTLRTFTVTMEFWHLIIR